ncbi:MAG: hypothetical protein SW833_25715 [Cyanobacteriota bacterium]|nr:hypothetical protein [Cyanobacteriota bacterium]
MKPKLTVALFSLILGLFPGTSSAKAEFNDFFDYLVYCRVTGVETGQLASLDQADSVADVGLGNGTLLQALGALIDEDGKSWYSVDVLAGPNPEVKGKQGLIDPEYLTCETYDMDGNFISSD